MNLLVRKWGERMLRSRQYAAGVALLAAFFSFFSMPVIGWLSTVIIALVTLQNGPRDGLFVSAWAMLPAVALLYLGQYGIFINIVILHYLIVLLFATMLRKEGSWVNLLQYSALLGMTAVALLYYFAPNLQNVLMEQLTLFAKEYRTSLLNLRPGDIDLWIKYIGYIAIGLLALGVIISNVMALFLARGWQSIVSPSFSAQKEFHGIRLHYGASLLFLGVIAATFVESSLSLNFLVVAMLPFVIAGLSLLHCFSATRKNNNTFLFVFYLLFLFLSPYMLSLLAIMGILDSFVNFRKKIVLDSPSREPLMRPSQEIE